MFVNFAQKYVLRKKNLLTDSFGQLMLTNIFPGTINDNI